MIKVTINGKTKLFDPGMTVNDILEEFDSQYLQYVCAVNVNGKRLGPDDTVDSDCEMELLSFRDLGSGRPSNDIHISESEMPSMDEDAVNPDAFISDDVVLEYARREISLILEQNEDPDELDDEKIDDDVFSLRKLAAMMDRIDSIDNLNSGSEEGENSFDEEPDMDNVFDDAELYRMAFTDFLKKEDASESAERENNESSEHINNIEHTENHEYTDHTQNIDTDEDDDEAYSEEDGPDLDGEFISFMRVGSQNVEEDADDAVLAETDADAAFDQSVSQETEESRDIENTEGAENIEDIVYPEDTSDDQSVAEASEDTVADGNEETTSDADMGDYSIDDGDMDAFIASQTLPDKSAETASVEMPGSSGATIAEKAEEQESGHTSNYSVDEDSINDFVDYSNKDATAAWFVGDFHDEDEESASPKKRRIPLFIKVAVFAAVLLGVGWMVGRIAIQASGSSVASQGQDEKTPVSVSDVSPSDISEVVSETDSTTGSSSTSSSTSTSTSTSATASTTQSTTAEPEQTTATKKTTKKTSTTTRRTTTTSRRRTTTTTKRRTTTTTKRRTTTKAPTNSTTSAVESDITSPSSESPQSTTSATRSTSRTSPTASTTKPTTNQTREEDNPASPKYTGPAIG